MRSFRTELTVSKSSVPIELADPILTIGSCFSDSIGQLLKDNKLGVSINPLGTLYNPIALHSNLLLSLSSEAPAGNLWIEHQGISSHLNFHSSFSSPDRTQSAAVIEAALAHTRQELVKNGTIIITYGTAFIYEHRPTGERIANCHKLPSSQFSKILLTSEEIVQSFKDFYEALKFLNPGKRIILTLSPVRHLRDTFELNAVSKSTVRVAIHDILSKFPDVSYFPGYEIMMDDLRDYRFYDRDLIHPSRDAIQYLWEKFTEQFFDHYTVAILQKWNDVRQALQHKPFNPESDEHQKFLISTLARLEELKNSIPVEEELKQLRAKLTK